MEVEKMKVTAYIEKVRRGYHIVRMFKSSSAELLSEEIFEYTNIRIAMKKLKELKKKHGLLECNYPNYITTFECEELEAILEV